MFRIKSRVSHDIFLGGKNQYHCPIWSPESFIGRTLTIWQRIWIQRQTLVTHCWRVDCPGLCHNVKCFCKWACILRLITRNTFVVCWSSRCARQNAFVTPGKCVERDKRIVRLIARESVHFSFLLFLRGPVVGDHWVKWLLASRWIRGAVVTQGSFSQL